MSDMVSAPETPVAETKGFTWRSLLRGAVITAIVVMVVILVLAGPIPPLIVFTVLWIVGLWLLRRPGKAAPIFLLVLFVGFLVTSAPFILPQLGVPASSFDFVLALAQALAGITAIVAAIAVLTGRGDRPSGAARALGGAAIGLFIAGIALSAFQNATFENDEAEEGDIEVTTVDLEFSPTAIEVDAGGAVFLRNDDPVLHTFTVDELDIDVDLPAGKTVRVPIDGDAGEYRFHCVPHQPDMEGTLTIR